MPVTPPPPRLSDEPAEWYERFKAWLNLPRPRSELELYNQERAKRRKVSQKKPDSPPGSWRGKAALYKWDERAAEWDSRESARRSAEHAAEIDEWLAEEKVIAKKMRDNGKRALDIPLVRGDVVTRETKIVDGREVIVEKITKLKGDPVAVKAAVYMIAEGLRIGRAALNIPDYARLWPLLAKYNLPIEKLTPAQRQSIEAGDDPLEIIIEAYVLLAQQQPAQQQPREIRE